jgi:hypothetical protein
MAARSCRVTVQDLDEAVAQGLAALRRSEWVEGIDERFGLVKVSVADVRVEHQVKIADFTKMAEPARAFATGDHRTAADSFYTRDAGRPLAAGA